MDKVADACFLWTMVLDEETTTTKDEASRQLREQLTLLRARRIQYEAEIVAREAESTYGGVLFSSVSESCPSNEQSLFSEWYHVDNMGSLWM